ncbi:MAG: carboxypeptidase-like regulatory domain-containing protein [Candidatus Omnitrophota bacterium]
MGKIFIIGSVSIFLFFSLNSPNHFVYAQEKKQTYSQLSGQVFNEWRKPLGGVAVILTAVANGYSTNSYTGMSDVNGKYRINTIPRYIYSSGPDPKVVDYYLTVNYPGYKQYTSETFNFQDSLKENQNILLTGNGSN